MSSLAEWPNQSLHRSGSVLRRARLSRSKACASRAPLASSAAGELKR